MKLPILILGGLAAFAAAHPSPGTKEKREVDECIVPVKHSSTTSHMHHHTTSTTKSTVKPTSTSISRVGNALQQTTSAAPKPSGKNIFTENGIKAGLSGYPGINLWATEGMDALAPYIGWYSDYLPDTIDYGKVQGIPMLWGDGNHCVSSTNVTSRVQDFYTTIAEKTPKIMFGFYEPDCDCPMSSDMADPVYGAKKWNQMIAPLAKKGTILGSPPLCKQTADDWLTPFKNAGLDADWDVTSIHINVHDLEGVKKDVEHYASTYGKPIWVSELACVHAGRDFFYACNNQAEIDKFINTVVPWLEANETVIAYGASNGMGLGNVWPLFHEGALTHTGNTYLNALKNLKK